MTIDYDANALTPEQVAALDAVNEFTALFDGEDPVESLTFFRRVQAAVKVLVLVPGDDIPAERSGQ